MTNKNPRPPKPFPWKCHHCGEEQVVMKAISFDAEFRHDGKLHHFTIPELKIPVCEACGEKVFNEKVDDQITDALRIHLHLLFPHEIRAGIDRLNLTQKELAERLGIAEATLSRWLTDTQIQSRALDNLLRVFFAIAEVRNVLQGSPGEKNFGTQDTGVPGRAAARETDPRRSLAQKFSHVLNLERAISQQAAFELAV